MDCRIQPSIFRGKLIAGGTGVTQSDLRGSVGSYFPYGENKEGSNPADDNVKFATYTRDSVSSLDYAVNRYHMPGKGRFGSVDPYQGSAEPADPVTWNRYSYIAGDPVNLLDRSGRGSEGTGDSTYDDVDLTPCIIGGQLSEVAVCDYLYDLFGLSQKRGDRPKKADVDRANRMKAYETAKKRLTTLAKQLPKTFNENCTKDLGKIGITDVSAIDPAAQAAVFKEGTYATGLYSDLYKGTAFYAQAQKLFGGLSIGDAFSDPRVGGDAMAQAFGHDIYIDGGSGAFDPTQASDGYDMALILHELAHNINGMTDGQMKVNIWGTASGRDSGAITDLLAKDCFGVTK